MTLWYNLSRASFTTQHLRSCISRRSSRPRPPADLLLGLYSLPRGAAGGSVFDKSVDVVLGAVLAGGHLEHVGDAQQGLAGLAVGDHLGTWG